MIQPSVELIVTQIKDITCNTPAPGTDDAEFSFVVNGGYTPYDIEVSYNGGAFTTHIANGVAPFANYTTNASGSYVFRVTDSGATMGTNALDCSFTTASFDVTDPVPPTITANNVDLLCTGDLGSATIQVTGIENPYQINFNGTGNVTVVGTEIVIPNLSADPGGTGALSNTYNFVITSDRGCTYNGSVTVNQPEAIIVVNSNEVPITCTGPGGTPTTGSISLEVPLRGTVGYTYTLVDEANVSVVPLVPATTTSPNPTIKINTDPTRNTVQFDGLAFGRYYIFVEDENGCEERFGPYTIQSQVTDLDLDFTIGATCPDGVTLDIEVVGGVGEFSAEVVGIRPVEGPPLNGLPAPSGGLPERNHQFTSLPFNTTYEIRIIDAGSNCVLVRFIDPVPPPSEPTITGITPISVSCNNPASPPTDGSVSFDVDGTSLGVGVTQISWQVYEFGTDNIVVGANGTAAVGSIPSPITVSGLGAGLYYVIVSEDDGTQCPAREDFEIDTPEPLSTSFTNQISANSCGRDAQVTMVTTGGIPFGIPPTTDGYTYAVVPTGAGDPGVYPLNNNVITLGSAVQTFDIWVADSRGVCKDMVTVTTTVDALPTITAVFLDDCAYDNTNVIDVDGTGLGTLLYQLDGGTPVAGSIDNLNHQFVVSTSGTYTVSVTDETGCTVSQNVTVYDPLDISAVFTTPPTCNAADGVIRATVTGTVAGTLTFELQDTVGGVIQAGVVGTSPFDFNGVAPGNYIVVVTDDGRGPNPGNCPFTAPVSITAPPQPDIDGTVGITNMTCNSDAPPTGSITVSLVGVLDPAVTYEYEITTAPGTGDVRPRQTSPVFNNLDVDSYTVRVWATLTNGTGGTALDVVCFDDQIFNILEPAEVEATVNQGDQFDCDGNPNATIEITNIIGGSGTGYTAEVTRPDATVVSNIPLTLPTTSIEAPIPGIYNIQVFDSNDCSSVVYNVNVVAYTQMFNPLVTQTQAISCLTPIPAGDEIVEVSVQGGSGDFLFEQINNTGGVIAAIDTPAGTIVAQFFNLTDVGTYTFRITDQGDANGLGLNCDITVTYDVPEFDFIEVNMLTPTDLTCFNDSSGSLSFEVLNYTGAFEYDVIDVATSTNVITATPVAAGFTNPITPGGLPAGEYEILVRETAYPFCSELSGRARIDQPDELILTVDQNINANCNESGRILVSVEGGTPPYTYSDGTNTTTTTSTTFEFSLTGSAAPGTSYTLTVTDANSCSDSENEDIVLTPDPTLSPLAVDDVCTHDGSYVITATGTTNVTGGTGELQFQLNGDPLVDPFVNPNNGATSHQFTVSTPGTYTVTARDENGCITNTESITILPALTASATFTADPTCRDFDGTVTVTVNGGSDFTVNPGNFTFELDGTDSNGAPFNVVQVGNNIFNNVSPGNYTILITDVNIPAITAPCSITIGVTPPDIPADPIITVASTVVSCVGATDGTVTITLDPTTTDDGPYTYQLFVDAGGGTLGAQVGTNQTDNPIFTNLATGDYVAVVMSDSSCTDQEIINVPNATQVIASTTQSPYICAADNSDIFPIITVTIQDGTPPYSVSYDTPSGNTVTSIAITDADPIAVGVQYEITANEEGDYDITVTDANGCATAPNAMITERVNPFPIMTNPQAVIVTDITCIVDEEIEVSVQGGSGDFTFAMIDNAGAVITPPAPIDTPPGTNVATFTVPRGIGIYTFRITDDVTMCTIDVTHEIDEYDFIAVTAVEESPETCLGAEDGTVRINISGYTGTYDFQVLEDDGVTPVTFAGANGNGNATTDPFSFVLPTAFPQGSYIIQITETASPNCVELSDVVTVTGPSEPLVATINEINTLESCDPASDGSFQVSVTGAQGTVTYELFLTSDTGFTTVLDSNQTGLFENLTANDYTVRVSDGNACLDTAQTVINAPNPITLNPLTKTDITCFGDANGTITATATGGQGAGTYLFILTRPNGTSDGASNISVFQNLGPGIYSVVATDNLGCTTAPQQIEIVEPSELTVNFTVDRNVTCPDPTVDVTVSGTSDVAITEYVLVNVTDPLNPVETNNGANNFFSSIPIGDYQFYVRDVNGCRSPLSGGLAVIPIPQIEFTLDLTAAFISCTDANNAVVDLADVTGGTGDYTFTLTGTLDAGGNYGGSPTGVSQATTEFRDLPAGNYTYTVTTDRQCSASDTFRIENPPLFEPVFTATPVTCNGEDDGMIRIEAIGGTPPYTFAIAEGSDFGEFLNDESDGIQGEHTFEDLVGGITYTVLAQDSRGCQEIQTFTIDEPAQLMVALDGPITPERCFGESNGAFTITISGGTAPYETNITNNDPDYVQDLFTYTDLPGGITTVFIRDANNCRISLDVEIPEGAILDGVLQNRMDCPVIDPTNGTVTQDPIYYIDFLLSSDSVVDDGSNIRYTLTPEGGTPIVQLTPTFTVMPDVNYQGMMTHIPSDCSVDLGAIRIDTYVPLNSVVATMTNNPQDPNEYEITVEGGSGDYTYFVALIPDGSTVNDLRDEDYRELDSNIFSIRETGDYALRVIDNMGCEVVVVQMLTYINIRIPNYFTPDGDGTDDLWYPHQITPNSDDPFFFQNMEVKVFDRYGRLLAEFVGDQRGWDGIYQGNLLPSGDYWYTVILNDIDNREFTGHFTLYR